MFKLLPKESIKEYVKKGFLSWKKEFYKYRYLILISLVIVVIASYLDYLSGTYVSSARVADVPDLILDHIGPYDLGLVFVYGYLSFVFALFLYPLILHISKLHKVIFQFSLLLTLRSFFLIFTHLQTPLDAIPVSFPWIFAGLRFSNDQFFSGHVVIIFLGFFLFERKIIKYLFLVGSIIMAIIVLLTHQHYSIDVFSAFFITYCSYKIGGFLLKRVNQY